MRSMLVCRFLLRTALLLSIPGRSLGWAPLVNLQAPVLFWRSFPVMHPRAPILRCLSVLRLKPSEAKSENDQTSAEDRTRRGGINITSGVSYAVQSPAKSSTGDRCYVVLNNLQSGGNIGRIVRSASIFGASEVVIIGQRKFRLNGDHGSRFDVPFHHFYTFEEAREYLVGEHGCEIQGIEIAESAEPLMKYDKRTGVITFPFAGPTAFVFGNEGAGLSERQRSMCDKIVFIPQNRGGESGAGGGSSSLNVACAAAIVLQAYQTWACFPSASREGEKFVSLASE